MHNIGVIHGRFQILHNDHIKYITAGLERCVHLIIGITNPDPTHIKAEYSDPKRSQKMSNPLTYYQRYQLIRAALDELNIDKKQYSIVPFPINFPKLYKYYLPLDAIYFLSIYDDWGREKLRKFQALNLATEVLWEVPTESKGISAQHIREKIILDQDWQYDLPMSTVNLLKKWNIKQILLAIK